MKTPQPPHVTVSDADLIAKVKRLAADERAATTDLLRSLMEFDVRRLYLGEGYPSLFAYCTQVLHYAEHAALNRIEVARAAKRFPVLLEHIAQGNLHITGARLIAPHLTDDNADALLAAARHRSKREIEELIAGLRPRPDVAPIIRKLPTAKAPSRARSVTIAVAEQSPALLDSSQPATVVTSAAARSLVAPFAPERFKVLFTITRETRDKLRQVQDLMRHVIPDGDPARIFDRALTMLLADLERKRFGVASRPQPNRPCREDARHIPAVVRRTVWQRDAGRCAFRSSEGRCGERGFLEFHHVVPFAVGGTATVENIELRCRAHNVYEASLFFNAEDPDFLGEGT
jgi:hypothetical protein